jgi:hypothetical protein
MDNKLTLCYILDRYKETPIEFMFVTASGDYYIAHLNSYFIYLGREYSDLISGEHPKREDYMASFYAEQALREAIEANDRNKIRIGVSSSELYNRFQGDENNIRFEL